MDFKQATSAARTARISLGALFLIGALFAAAWIAAVAAPGDCDGTSGDDTITCTVDPANPDTTVGLDSGNDTYVQEVNVDSSAVGGDTLPDGNTGTANGDDNITIDGVTAIVGGDGGIGDNGNDTITINGQAGNVIGDFNTGASDIGGDDIITVAAGGSVTGTVYGDLTLVGGDDEIQVDGSVGATVVGDSGGVSGGDDVIIINGSTGGSVIGDNVSGQGGDDTIVVNGSVGGDVVGDNADLGGADTIIVSGLVLGDIYADVATTGGDDYVYLADTAQVFGTIEGEGGFDTLEFESVPQSVLDGLNPAAGTIAIGLNTYTWTGFEQLLGFLEEMAEELGLRVLMRTEDLVVVADDTGISVFAPHGRIAFISYSAALDLGVGEMQSFATGKAAGWSVTVFNLGKNQLNPSNDLFQVSIWNSTGGYMGQFNFSE
jgi:hypothetical protein